MISTTPPPNLGKGLFFPSLELLRRWPCCLLQRLLRLYQRTLSQWLPPTCRFSPSCSEFAIKALDRYGVWKGGWISLCRVLRCHPFHPGGDDPVP